jgi:uncharacterized membrane protein YqaE (UPF0057 family)
MSENTEKLGMFIITIFCQPCCVIGAKYPPTLPMTNLYRRIWLASFSVVSPPVDIFLHPQRSNPETLHKGFESSATWTNVMLVYGAYIFVFECI